MPRLSKLPILPKLLFHDVAEIAESCEIADTDKIAQFVESAGVANTVKIVETAEVSAVKKNYRLC